MIRRILALVAVSVTAFAGVALAAQAGTYSGKTSQPKGSISLKVSGGKIVKITFVDGTGIGSGCSSAAPVEPQFPVSFKSHFAISKHASFNGKGSPRDQEVFKITGHFSGKSVSGSFTDSIPLGQETGHGITCRSGKVKFTAKLK